MRRGFLWRVALPVALGVYAGLALTQCASAGEWVEPEPIADVRLTVMPAIVMERSAVAVRCLVPRKPAHRAVAYGIEGVRVATKPLDGEGARIEHRLVVERVECGAWVAFCRVASADGSVESRTAPLRVLGMCDGGTK